MEEFRRKMLIKGDGRWKEKERRGVYRSRAA
jgi:hypothetical protein